MECLEIVLFGDWLLPRFYIRLIISSAIFSIIFSVTFKEVEKKPFFSSYKSHGGV